MLGKTEKDIIAAFGKPKEHIEKSDIIIYYYDANYWDEWNERYQIYITRWDYIWFTISEDRVIAYGVFRGGEPSSNAGKADK
jgi:hypothetical protein